MPLKDGILMRDVFPRDYPLIRFDGLTESIIKKGSRCGTYFLIPSPWIGNEDSLKLGSITSPYFAFWLFKT